MLGLLPSPWLILGLVLSLASTYGFGFYRGSTTTAAALHVTELRETVELQQREVAKRDAFIAEVQKQASATSRINEAASARADDTEKYARQLEEKLRAYQNTLAKGGDRADCRLTATDAAGLRQLGR